MTRIRQRSDSHCGPAVVVMLASYLGIPLKQHSIVLAAHAEKKYIKNGMTVSELCRGVLNLRNDISFWTKKDSSIAELDLIINRYKFPVGVEWQGEFGEYADEDNGHYSVATYLDIPSDTIMLSDPFYYFAFTDRTFRIGEFDRRWWDVNDITDYEGSVLNRETDTRTLFVMTPGIFMFPEAMGLRKTETPGF